LHHTAAAAAAVDYDNDHMMRCDVTRTCTVRNIGQAVRNKEVKARKTKAALCPSYLSVCLSVCPTLLDSKTKCVEDQTLRERSSRPAEVSNRCANFSSMQGHRKL